jgi:hypothetical protein
MPKPSPRHPEAKRTVKILLARYGQTLAEELASPSALMPRADRFLNLILACRAGDLLNEVYGYQR